MSQKTKHSNKITNSIPLIGIIVFTILYFYSSTLYPGGSQADLNSEGYDWINNYWCNLMNEKGMNGRPNAARPFAIVAMTILCLSLMLFFIKFADTFAENLFWNRIIKYSGILSMVFAILIFTKQHDLMTIVSSFFGLFVVVGIIKEVYRSALSHFKISGIVCLFLLGLNNYIYYSEHFLEWLPLIQKVTFLIVLIWIAGLNLEIGKGKA